MIGLCMRGWRLALAVGPWIAVSPPNIAAQPREAERPTPAWVGERAADGSAVEVALGQPVFLRGGPGAAYAIVATAQPGERLPLVARLGDWYAVEVSPGHSGWVREAHVRHIGTGQFEEEPHRFHRRQSFVFSPLTGMYAGEQQSHALLMGGRFGYFLTESVEFELGIDFSRVDRQRDWVEDLFSLTLEESSFNVLHYQANGVYHVAPGRRLTPFVTAGIGTATTNAKTEWAWNAGGGALYFVRPDAALRLEVRNYHFTMGTALTRRAVDNMALGLGVSVLF